MRLLSSQMRISVASTVPVPKGAYSSVRQANRCCYFRMTFDLYFEVTIIAVEQSALCALL